MPPRWRSATTLYHGQRVLGGGAGALGDSTRPSQAYDIGVRIDAALGPIEADTPRLKGILANRFGPTQLEPGKLGELVDAISTIGFGEGHHAKDRLGQFNEYFLGQLARVEFPEFGEHRYLGIWL